MSRPEAIHSLDVVLTAQCNLRCGYCYQTDKNSRSMDWMTLQASLDLLLRSKRPELDVVFYGGEPLLEFALIKRGVEYVESKRNGRQVTYTLSSNGLLIDDGVIAFLARHRVKTQLSFDGVPEAQQLRGLHTFDKLDALIDRIRLLEPTFFEERFRVSITLLGSTVRHLGDSIRYLLGKQVAEVQISPVFTHDPTWTTGMIAELDAQFERIRNDCLRRYRETGTVPLALFRKTEEPTELEFQGRSMCGIARGETPAVDVDGVLNPCLTLADSYQSFSSDFLRTRADSVRLGHVQDEELPDRLALLSDKIRAAGIFTGKQNKYSSYGRCGDCRYFAECAVCPVSIGHIPGNTDPDRVPDLLCAFQLVIRKHAELFEVQPGPRQLLLGEVPEPSLVAELMAATGSR